MAEPSEPNYNPDTELGCMLKRIRDYWTQLNNLPDRTGGQAGAPGALIQPGGSALLPDVINGGNFIVTSKAGWVLLADSTGGLGRLALQRGNLSSENIFYDWQPTSNPLLTACGIYVDGVNLRVKLGATATARWVQWWFSGKSFA